MDCEPERYSPHNREGERLHFSDSNLPIGADIEDEARQVLSVSAGGYKEGYQFWIVL